MSTFTERLIRNSDRRKHAESLVTPCPECGTEQVQLVEWLSEQVQLVEWLSDTIRFKCRRCKHEWHIEDKYE